MRELERTKGGLSGGELRRESWRAQGLELIQTVFKKGEHEKEFFFQDRTYTLSYSLPPIPKSLSTGSSFKAYLL